MKLLYIAIATALALMPPGPCSADDNVGREIRALYERFVTAQNNRDLTAVRDTLSDREDFLWISDGKPFWGRDAMIERMASFQTAEVWRVEPEYRSAKTVVVGPYAAYLHIPLVLILGSKQQPGRLKWLVQVLCRREGGGWRIAALFTAEDKRP
jgi:uncharacterized protein (TIGR02246 family)